ncbi:hypothetical protein CFAM422_000500 [Trichoderma lentiforme]|uniref:DNA2/NAM7 helicase-like C-terminal domain-containing protein n=1 Tax=Trichoderma lentiforme TaxID=1567552 RepID=A0A9P4XPT3_9HYPO|nr:hypothetical protein CFAM422_000500 [Trichoderma lentiforme]
MTSEFIVELPFRKERTEPVSRLVPYASMFSAQSYPADLFDAEREYRDMNKDEGKEREGRTQQFMRSYEWERILTITGYSEQKCLLQETLAELPEADVPRGLVSVRTIDDSPSHQAEVVICDLVRIDTPGFMVEDERLAVMTTNHTTSNAWEKEKELLFYTNIPGITSYKEPKGTTSTFLKRENTMREIMSSLDKTQLEKLWKLRELTSLDKGQIQEL